MLVYLKYEFDVIKSLNHWLVFRGVESSLIINKNRRQKKSDAILLLINDVDTVIYDYGIELLHPLKSKEPASHFYGAQYVKDFYRFVYFNFLVIYAYKPNILSSVSEGFFTDFFDIYVLTEVRKYKKDNYYSAEEDDENIVLSGFSLVLPLVNYSTTEDVYDNIIKTKDRIVDGGGEYAEPYNENITRITSLLGIY